MRIDKYIWAVRIYKTRSLATTACNEGKVLLNNEKIKPSKTIKENDIISIKITPIWKTFKIIDFPKSRVGAKLVHNFVIDTTSEEDLVLLENHELIIRQNRSMGIKGRPTKKARRNLGKLYE